MQISISESGNTEKKVTLIGKLDFTGTQTIEQPMATVLRCNIVVDMTGVDFLASIANRHLGLAPRSVTRA